MFRSRLSLVGLRLYLPTRVMRRGRQEISQEHVKPLQHSTWTILGWNTNLLILQLLELLVWCLKPWVYGAKLERNTKTSVRSCRGPEPLNSIWEVTKTNLNPISRVQTILYFPTTIFNLWWSIELIFRDWTDSTECVKTNPNHGSRGVEGLGGKHCHFLHNPPVSDWISGTPHQI